MLLATLLGLNVFALVNHEAGFRRFEGEFAGPMNYFDLSDRKQKQFPISMRLMPQTGGATMAIKYRYAPGQYDYSVSSVSVNPEGTQMRVHTTGETLIFTLRNWSEFCAGAEWFEIERDRGEMLMRFRYTFTTATVISEKSLKRPGLDWEFSHRMDLKRVNSPSID